MEFRESLQIATNRALIRAPCASAHHVSNRRFAQRLVGRLQRNAGKSQLVVKLAIKIKNQCDMVIGQRVGSGHAFAQSGELWLMQQLAPQAKLFVDVGANVGEWSLKFARMMTAEPKGLLFEAAPRTAEHLRRVIRNEGLDGKLEIVAVALSDHHGEAVFYEEPGTSETSSLHTAANISPSVSCTVKLARLDDQLHDRNIAHVCVLKIDTEGHDFFVLRGAEKYISTHRIDVIQFEYNYAWLQAGATLNGAYDFFARIGYKVRLLKQGMLGDLDVRRCGDFFRYANFVAYRPSKLGALLDAQKQYSVL